MYIRKITYLVTVSMSFGDFFIEFILHIPIGKSNSFIEENTEIISYSKIISYLNVEWKMSDVNIISTVNA